MNSTTSTLAHAALTHLGLPPAKSLGAWFTQVAEWVSDPLELSSLYLESEAARLHRQQRHRAAGWATLALSATTVDEARPWVHQAEAFGLAGAEWLPWALHLGAVPAVQALMDAGVDPLRLQVPGGAALEMLLATDHAPAIATLLAVGVDARTCPPVRRWARRAEFVPSDRPVPWLVQALAQGAYRSARLLVDAGALDVPSAERQEVLDQAVMALTQSDNRASDSDRWDLWNELVALGANPRRLWSVPVPDMPSADVQVHAPAWLQGPQGLDRSVYTESAVHRLVREEALTDTAHVHLPECSARRAVLEAALLQASDLPLDGWGRDLDAFLWSTPYPQVSTGHHRSSWLKFLQTGIQEQRSTVVSAWHSDVLWAQGHPLVQAEGYRGQEFFLQWHRRAEELRGNSPEPFLDAHDAAAWVDLTTQKVHRCAMASGAPKIAEVESWFNQVRSYVLPHVQEPMRTRLEDRWNTWKMRAQEVVGDVQGTSPEARTAAWSALSLDMRDWNDPAPAAAPRRRM